jgi:hypothetical protein
VDLTDHSRLVTVCLKCLLELRLIVVKATTIVVLAVHVTVLAGEKRCARGTTDRVGDVAAIKGHAVMRKGVNVWREVLVFEPAWVRTYGLIRMVVRE